MRIGIICSACAFVYVPESINDVYLKNGMCPLCGERVSVDEPGLVKISNVSLSKEDLEYIRFGIGRIFYTAEYLSDSNLFRRKLGIEEHS